MKRNIKITSVDVEVKADFGAEGEPGYNVEYKPTITSDVSDEEIQQLIMDTDKVAEIHKTLRRG